MAQIATTFLDKHIPAELFEYRNWVAYRLVAKDDGKTDKKPINPHTGGLASSTNPATWGTVDQALACAEEYLLSGVGFVFTDSPYCGVDLDHCVDGTSIKPWAKEFIALLDSYAETSQSGTGVHVITRGNLPEGRHVKKWEDGKVEMYDTGRFFTFTGQHVEGTPKTINERTEALAELHRRVFGDPQPTPSPALTVNSSPSDEAIIQQITSPIGGCPTLWCGDWKEYDSQSEADLALCNNLVFWTRGDAERADRLFRQSGLYRPKWDEKHYGDGRTYGQATIQKAIEGATSFATPPSNNGTGPAHEGPSITVYWANEALKPQPPIDWVIEDLFSIGSVSLLVGEGGSKKTYAMLDASICVALGHLWLGFATHKSIALLIDEESGPRRLARRIGDAMRGHGGGPDTQFAYVTLAGFDLRQVASVNTLQAVVEVTQARFVVLDSLVDFMLGGDENAVQDVQPVFHNLRTIAEAQQCAVVVIHHTNKTGSYRGSSAMKGAVDLMLVAESKPDSDIITFRTEKARDIEPVTFAATANFEPDKFYLSPATPDTSTLHYPRSEVYVLRYLEENGKSSVNDIKSHADTCSGEAARRAVYRLAEKGDIRRVDSGGQGREAIYELSDQGVVTCAKL